MTAQEQTLAALAARAGVGFGTSGVRGRVADLSAELCRAYTQAFLKVSGLSAGPFLIGRDLRPSSPAIAQACCAEASIMGFGPIHAGVVPTPALAHAAERRGLPAIMVTGSHIPFDRNGIKFYLPHGEISKQDEQRILATPVRLTDAPPCALPEPDTAVLDAYAARYETVFAGSLTGMRLGVYEHSSAARDLLHRLLRALGAATVSLGRSDDFIAIDTEAVREEDRLLARTWASEYRLDAILTTDGDADRPLIADETGEWLRGDVLGIICARALGARTVVTPVSSNTALEACDAFAKTIRTRIGSPHVIAAMEAARQPPVVGYEANGGFLLGTDVTVNGKPLAALRTRDAMLPMIMALAAARREGGPLSRLVRGLPRRYTFSDRLQEVNVDSCRELLARLSRDPAVFPVPGGQSVDTTDGVRVTLDSGGILHLRLSGNAPELRCYAEASSSQEAMRLCRDCLAAVSTIAAGKAS